MSKNKNSNWMNYLQPDSILNMRSTVSGLFVVGLVILAALACFFFPVGRTIIRYSGYLFIGILAIFIGFITWDQSMEVSRKMKNGEEGFEKDNPKYKKAVIAIATTGIITILMVIAFFFPVGRHVIELSGYVFFVMIIIGLALICFDIINEIRAFRRKKTEELEKKWAECPYEVEPAYERADCSEPSEVKLDSEDVKTSTENESLDEDEKVYVFDSSALKNMAGQLYGAFLTEQYGKKVLHLSEEDEAQILDHELKILMKDNEKETFPGCAAYISNIAKIVKASKDCEDVLQREDSIINYLQFLLIEGRNAKLVTDNPHLTDIAKKKEIPILSTRDLLA